MYRFIALLVALLLAACGLRAEALDLANEITEARTMFNSEIMQHLDHQNRGKNVLVSTYGLHSVLSMVLAGSKDGTFAQLWNALGYKNTKLDRQTMLDAYRQTFSNLRQLDTEVFTFGNLLCVDSKVSLNEQYRKDLARAFGVEELIKDFQNNNVQATNDLNEWVKEHTRGKIESIFPKPLSRDTSLVLANALHLKANWTSQFAKELDYVAPFNLADGRTKNVTYMTISGQKLKFAQYKRFFGFEVVRIPFDSEARLWFSIILPNSIVSNFDSFSGLTHFAHAAQTAHVELTIPKFKIAQTHDKLVEVFRNLGVTDLFDAGRSDLSGIDNKRDLFVSDIAHKTTLEIDETGAEGAAVTATVLLHHNVVFPPITPQVVKVDKPFLFVISDRLTNIDFFTGLVYDP